MLLLFGILGSFAVALVGAGVVTAGYRTVKGISSSATDQKTEKVKASKKYRRKQKSNRQSTQNENIDNVDNRESVSSVDKEVETVKKVQHTKEDSNVEPVSEQVRENTVSKEECLNKLVQYKENLRSGINGEGLSIEGLIVDKLKEYPLVNDDNRDFVIAAIKSSWDNVSEKVTQRVDRLIKQVETTEDFNKVLDQKPIVDLDMFVNGGAFENIVKRTVSKHEVYKDKLGSIKNSISKFDNSDSNVRESNEYIVGVIDVLKKKVVSPRVTLSDFSLDIDREVNQINNEVNNMSRNQHFTSIMGNIASLKADDKNLTKKLDILESMFEQQSEEIKALKEKDLKVILDKMQALDKLTTQNDRSIGKVIESLLKEFEIRKKQAETIKELKASLKQLDKVVEEVKKDVSKKVDEKVMLEEINKIDKIIGSLGDVDLINLSKVVEGLREDFDNVEESAKKIVSDEVNKLEDKIRDFAKRSIGVRIGKKFSELEDNVKKMVADEVLCAVSKETSKITDEDIEKIVGKVIDNIKISKKK